MPKAPPGNAKRPIIHNRDGSFSTERTITIGTDRGFYNVPTIVDGIQRKPSEAIALFRAGKNAAVDSAATEPEALTKARARSAAIGRSRKAEARRSALRPSPARPRLIGGRN